MIIDVHNHFIPEAYMDAVRSDPEAMGARVDGESLHLTWRHSCTVGARHLDLKRRIQVLDEARIDVAAIGMRIGLTGYNYPPNIGRGGSRR